MNNRQFLITTMFFLLVITGYNQFVTLPKAREAQRIAEEQLRKEVALRASQNVATGIQKEITPSVKPEELFTLNLPQADVTFSSKGAGIKTYEFKDVLGPVDLTPYPGDGFFATLPQVDFTEVSRTHQSIAFEATLAAGLTMSKTYEFADNHLNHLRITLKNSSSQNIQLPIWNFNFGPGISTVKSEIKDNERESKAVYLVQEEGKKNPSLKVMNKNEKQPELTWMWAGLENRYFLSVLIPQGWKPGKLNVEKPVITTQKRLWGLLGDAEVKGPQLQIEVPATTLEAGQKVVYDSDFYFGPKDYNEFLQLPYHLDRSIAFGFFGALGKIARNVLETFYGWTGNYGVAIIMLTICLQILLFKFTVMQFKSAAQMKKIQPEMKRIQEKYKGNQQELNRATLALYQKHKVNPLAGCLPLLIQLPIFLALFNALRTSWSLHGAKFVLWITDLSSKDPYYILPILMGGVMFLQQRGNIPAGTDPAQAAMFKYMPLIFTLLFMNFPSGLVLYWLTNSLLTFGIQTLINKKMAKAN